MQIPVLTELGFIKLQRWQHAADPLSAVVKLLMILLNLIELVLK